MRALTLTPHWAHAIAHMNKRIENRSRHIPLALVGQRIAIHAGATLPTGWALELAACNLGPNPQLREEDIATRGIVATALLAYAERSSSWDVPPWAMRDAAWWWHLADVRVLRRVVPVQRGQLGLWRLDAETEREVTDAE